MNQTDQEKIIKYNNICINEELLFSNCKQNEVNNCHVFEKLYSDCMQFKKIKTKIKNVNIFKNNDEIHKLQTKKID